MNIFLGKNSEKIIAKLRELPQREAEGLFLSLTLYIFKESEDYENITFSKLIKLFTEAGKDVSFIGAYNFGLRFPENKSYYVNLGPLTRDEIHDKLEIDKLVQLFSSKYQETYRLPQLNLDLKKYIQGFVTGYDPKTIRDNTRISLLQEINYFKDKYEGLKERIPDLQGDFSKLSTEKLKKLHEKALNLVKQTYIKYIKTHLPNSKVDLSWKLKDLKIEMNKIEE